MTSCQLKLQLRPTQERKLVRDLWHLTGAYNWAIRKITGDAQHGIRLSRIDLQNLIAGHGTRIGVQQHTLRATVWTAHDAWQRCFRRVSGRPHMKGRRNRLNSIPFPKPIASPDGRRIRLPGLGMVKFHGQHIPEGSIKCGRVVRRASGWYLCLVVDAEPVAVPVVANREVGIDPGFASLITLSTGEKVDHPKELVRTSVRLAQAQRGGNRTLSARLTERGGNQRRDRNHKLARRLVAENALIAWSKDHTKAIARTFGKSVASAAHGQLREFIACKSRTGGRRFVEVPNRYSTSTCAACRARSGPVGYAGLKVRQWTCRECGSQHDRDVNAARNTLAAARGMRVECARKGASGIASVSNTAKSIEAGHG